MIKRSAGRENKVHAAGQLKRLRSRLVERGPDALEDVEVVQYLLIQARVEGDARSRAEQLLREYGTIGSLLSADGEALARSGLSDPAVGSIKIVEAAALKMLRATVEDRPVLATSDALIAYVTADAGYRLVERVRVLFLNARHMLIRDEVVSEGTINEASVHVREVMRRSLDLGAVSIIIIHNHPSGSPEPSRQDIALTRALVDAGRALHIVVLDHIIVAADHHVSLREMGLM